MRKIDKTAFKDCDFTKLAICAAVDSCPEAFAMKNKPFDRFPAFSMPEIREEGERILVMPTL